MSDPVFRSGLASSKAIEGSISVSSVDNRGMIDLRGDSGDKKFVAACKKVLGLSLPVMPRQSTGKKDITALWLSPDQWLVTCPRDSSVETAQKLQAVLSGIHSLVVDVSDARSIFRLEGDGAREVLMKGAPVDLTTGDYGEGYVRRLRFAEMAALIHVVSDTPEVIDLFVFRSYGQYAWEWLAATSSKQSKLQIFIDQPVAAV